MDSDLHWHRLPGLHAAIRASFAPRASLNRFVEDIISDEVGLGKTYAAAAVIAFQADAALRQKAHAPHTE